MGILELFRNSSRIEPLVRVGIRLFNFLTFHKMTLKELAVDHDYYCSDQNYNDVSAMETYRTWDGFMADNEGMDIDLNLCFRFDIKLKNDENETEGYFMQLSVMQQRRGKYVPIIIETVIEEDVPSIGSFLSGHFEKMKQLWQPFSF